MVGAATEHSGLALTQTTEQRRRTAQAQQRIAAAGLDRLLGVAPAPLLVPATWDVFSSLPSQVESDANGLAGRVETATSVRHRHLLQAGMLLGIQAWMADALMDQAPVQAPHALARHLALAGVPEPLWRPLSQPLPGDTPARRRDAFQRQLQVLQQALMAPEFGAVP